MVQLVIQGFVLGVLLAFLIGPVFFALLDKSISKGKIAALVFDLGVLSSDILCLVLAYLGSKQLERFVTNNPWFFFVGGAAIVGYGLYLFVRPFNYQRHPIEMVPTTRNAIGLFSKGFLLNIINPGVLLFWITVVLMVGGKYDFELATIVIHFGATFLAFAICDTLKIFGAAKLKQLMRPRMLFKFQRALAGGLILWGLFVLIKGF